MGDMPGSGIVAKIGTAVTPANFATAKALDAAGYAALTGELTIGRRTSIGALPIGDKYNSGTYAVHDDRREVTQKTTKQNPEWQVVTAWDIADTGQSAAIAGAATDNWYPITLEWPDAPSGGTPTTAYFHVLVMDAEAGESPADAEKVDLTIRCMIMTEVLLVDAAAP